MGQYGSRLEERYFLQKVKLGQGSFGTVWRAVDKETDRPVAIKQIDKYQMRRRGITREHTAREISMLRACSHENVTSLYHTYEDDRSIYLALEYCDGGDFGDKLKERAPILLEAEAADWTRQMLSAIAVLHMRAICHRDIKPDNFMVSGRLLKLSDFGLAVHLPEGKLLSEKSGTPAFMAPEQHTLPASKGYGYPVDIWAAGVVAFMLLCDARHPFMTARDQMDLPCLLRGELKFVDGGFFGLMKASLTEERFSEDARQFCAKLVNAHPEARPSAERALQHRWLRVSGPSADIGNQGYPASAIPQKNGVDQPIVQMDTWVAAGKAATEAASAAMATAPGKIARALEEVRDAMQAPNPFATPGRKIQSEEVSKLEFELLNMGATPQDLLEVKELVSMGAEVHDVRQSMRKAIAERPLPSAPHFQNQEALRAELLNMGFRPQLVEEAVKRCSSSSEAVDWIIGAEKTSI